MPSSAAPQLKRYNAKHRGTNTYKFQGFNERINSIHLNLHHHTALLASNTPSAAVDPLSTESHFAVELDRQRELDASAAFTACFRQLRPLCRSFPLVMHHKQRIVRVLILSLSQPGLPSPAPYLALLTTLIRDLRYDIYPLFPYILASLLPLLHPSAQPNPDHLQQLFSALLYTFKYLSRELTRDVVAVYGDWFGTLLRSDRWYVRKFAAEAFAYLVRKVRDDKRYAVYDAMLQWPANDDSTGSEGEGTKDRMEEDERESGDDEAVSVETLRREAKRAIRVSGLNLNEYRDGVASVLFHTHRTVEHSFHSLAPTSLPILLSFLLPASASPADAALSSHRSLIITAFFRRLANYTRREQSELVWTTLNNRWQLLSKQWIDEHDKKDSDWQQCRSIEMARLLELLALWTAFRQGSRIQSPPLVLAVCQSSVRPALLLSANQTSEYKQAVIHLLCAFTQVKPSLPHRQQLQLLFAQLFSARSNIEPQHLAEVVERLRRVDAMDGLLVRWTFGYVDARVKAEDETGRDSRRGEWMRLVLLACQHYRLYDEFYYVERSREQPIGAADGEEKLVAVNRLITRMPSTVVGQAVRQVMVAMESSELDENEVERVNAALQVLPLSGTEDVNTLLSDDERQRIKTIIANQRRAGTGDHIASDGEEEEENDDDEEDDFVTLHQLLTAFAIHIHSLLPSLPHPSSHPPLPLFSHSAPSPRHHHSATPTSSAIDRHLYLITRALVSSHLLSSTLRPASFLLSTQHRSLIELLSRYGAHPAVLRSLLSLLSLVAQDSLELPALRAAVLSQQCGQQLMGQLSASLSHPSATVRLLSLHILSLHPQLHYLPSAANSTSTLAGPCPLISQLLSLSLLQPSIANERQLEKLLANIEVLITSHRLPLEYVRVLLPAMLGQLRLKMASVWARVQRCVAALLAGYASELRDEWMSEMRRSEEDTRVMVSEEDKRRMDGGEDVELGTEARTDAEHTQASEEEPSIDEQPEQDAQEAEEEEEEVEGEDGAEQSDAHVPDADSVAVPTLSTFLSRYTQTTTRSTDVYMYHSLLQRTLLLDDAKPFADKNSAPLSSLFLLFYHTEYQHVYPLQDKMPAIALLPLDEALRAQREQQVRVMLPTARKQAKVKLLHFLRLFNTAFSSLHSLDRFRSYFPVFLYRLLIHHDTEVQTLALQCLAKYKYAFLTPYLPSLLRLVDEGTHREEMATFHLSPAVSVVERSHRVQLSAVLVRLLFTKMEKRKEKRGKRSTADRRSVVLAYLAGLQEDEITALIAIMLQPWQHLIRLAAGEAANDNNNGYSDSATVVKSKKDKKAEDEQVFVSESTSHLPALQPSSLSTVMSGLIDLDDPALVKQMGFLRLLEALLSQMRSVVQRYLPHVCLVLMRMLGRVMQRIEAVRQKRDQRLDEQQLHEDGDEAAVDEVEESDEPSGDDDKREYKLLRNIRQLIYARFATILDLYPFHFQSSATALPTVRSSSFVTSVHVDLSPFLSTFLSLTSASITALPIEQTQHKAGLLSVIVVLASHAELLPALLSTAAMLPAVFGLLAAPRVAPEVVRAVLSVCEKLLAREDEGRKAKEEERVEARRERRLNAAVGGLQRQTQRTLTREERRNWDSSDEDEDEEMDEGEEQTRDEQLSVARSRTDKKQLAAAVSAAWSTHISTFLHHMHSHLSSASTSSYPRRQLSIIASVASHARDADTVDKLTALLLPLLTRLNKLKQRQLSRDGDDDDRRGLNKDAIQHSILTILNSTIRLHPSPEALVPLLSRQFILLSSAANRALLASIFQLLSERVVKVGLAARLLMELTAVSSSRVGEMDYDRIVEGYAQLREKEDQLGEEGEAVLLYVLLQQVNEDEMGVRGQAVDAIKRLCKTPGGGREPTVTDVVYPAIKRGIKHKSDKIRREWLLLLHHLIITFPALYSGFRPLLHDNPDLDFLLNITHIQSHRRAKALSRLQFTLPLLPARVLIDVILPLVNEALLSSAGEGSGVESRFSTPHSRAQRGGESGGDVGLMEAAVGLLRLMGGLLPFSAYYAQLLSYVRLMRERKREAMEKLMIRAICAMVEGWKYDVIEGQQMSEQERKDEQHAIQRYRRPQRQQTRGRPTKPGKAAGKQEKSKAQDEEKKEQEAKDEVVDDAAAEGVEEKVEPVDEELPEEMNQEDDTPAVGDEDEAAAEIDIDELDDTAMADETLAVISVRSAAESAAQRARTLAFKVRHTLSTSLLPQLHSLLTGTKRGDSLSLLRPALALAIVHLLGRLPSDFFDLHFPRLLTSLLSQLQRREQEARDVTRRVMVDMVPVIGVQRLATVLDEARATMRRGNQPHVLGYYIHCVLERLVRERVAVGLLDDCVECVMGVVMDEMVGEVGREKEVDALKRQAKEVRMNKSMEVVEALSELCSFDRIVTVITPLRQSLSASVRSDEVRKIKEALRRVAEGLMRNRGLDVRQLLVFVYGLVKEVTEAAGGGATTTKPKVEEKKQPTASAVDEDDSDDEDEDEEELTAQEKAARMRPSKAITLGVQKPTIATSRAALSATHNAPIVLHFALSLLNNSLAHHKIHESEPGMREMLDPYLHLLASACLLMKTTGGGQTKAKGATGAGMGAVSNEVIDMALRICNHLLRFSSLPSLPSFVPPFNSFLFTLLTSGQSSLTSAAFKTLSILIYHSKCTFTPQQLSLLFSFMNQDLTSLTDTSFVFPLLHSILSRQLLHADLYDTMSRVAELAVVSNSPLVRHRCGELFVLFLLDYPIGVKRMRQHLTFVLSQLSYSVKAGRLSALSVLSEVVRRFPVVVLDEWVELLVLPLLLVLVNEDEAEVREAAGAVIRAVIGRVSGEKQRMVGRWLDSWMETAGEETPVERVRRCGAMQCYGLMVDVVDGGMDEKQLATMMKHVTAVVRNEDRRLAKQQTSDEVKAGMKSEEKDEDVALGREDEDEDEEEDDEEQQPMEDVQNKTVDNDGEEGDSSVQSPSGDWRLLYLTLLTLEKALKQPPPLRDRLAPYLSPSSPSSLLRSLIFFLLHPHSWIRSVSARLFSTLLASSYELPADITFRLIKSSCMQLNTQPLREKLAANVAHNLFALVQHALTLDWTAQQDEPTVDEQKAVKPSLARIHSLLDSPGKIRALNWMFHRLSYLARQLGDVRRLAILSLFRSIITTLPYSSWSPYLLSLMHALFRLSNQELDGRVKDEAVVLMEELQRRVDSAVFLTVYNEVRGGVLGVRRDRREKRKVMALTDPAQFVRRKQDKHQLKRESRKQRLEHSKLAKYVRGATAADVRQRMEQTGGAASGEKRKKRMRQQ